MNKDQLIQQLKIVLRDVIQKPALLDPTQDAGDNEPLVFRERCDELLATVPLTESEERIEAMREEILARSEAKAAPVVQALKDES